jgi:hypothetical protein
MDKVLRDFLGLRGVSMVMSFHKVQGKLEYVCAQVDDQLQQWVVKKEF